MENQNEKNNYYVPKLLTWNFTVSEYIIMSYIYSILKFYVVEYSPFMKFQMTTLS